MPRRSSSRLHGIARAGLLLLALLPGCRAAGPTTRGAPHPEDDPLLATVRHFDRIAAGDLWPGFDARAVPIAISDGTRTLLLRHPRPPSEFTPSGSPDGGHLFAGRHPSVTANSSVLLESVPTATLLPDFGRRPPEAWARTLAHEAFHVFQSTRHPDWRANEADLFTYPVDRADLLAQRREESEALRRAGASTDPAAAACWARAALEARERRFAALPAASAAYERGSELNEGLATYVEHRAGGAPAEAAIPAAEFAPEAVRQRGYAAGLALALLLDRFAPGWRETLERGDPRPLDRLLRDALPPATAACGPSPAQRDALRRTAEADVAALRARRAERERDFLARPGVRLVLEGAPLFPQGFDPLNVHPLGGGRVLHTRFLRLGGGGGSVEVLGRDALTEAAGAHPLFNGVRRLVLTALGEPVVTRTDGVLTLRADGVQLSLRGAGVERQGDTLRVRVPGP